MTFSLLWCDTHEEIFNVASAKNNVPNIIDIQVFLDTSTSKTFKLKDSKNCGNFEYRLAAGLEMRLKSMLRNVK